MTETVTVKINNMTSINFPLFQTQTNNVTWEAPSIVNAGQTIETTLTFFTESTEEDCYGLLRFSTGSYTDFQIRAYSEGGTRLETYVSYDLEATPTGTIPVVDQETLTVSFAEIAQKKGEPCSSKKDAKKAKESKSKGKRLT